MDIYREFQPKVKLVFTSASKEELPIEFIKAAGWPIVTVNALKSGILSTLKKRPERSSILFVITGVGREKAIDAAFSICKLLTPLAVVNIGACGLNCSTSLNNDTAIVATKTFADGKWRKCLFPPPFPIPTHLKTVQGAIESLLRPLYINTVCISKVVDMEAGFQHQIFDKHNIAFSAIKIPTDLCSSSTKQQFKRHIARVRKTIKRLLHFLRFSARDMETSVIIPVHNRPVIVKRAIESVLNQICQPKEIIVVDDGSDPPLDASLDHETKERIKLVRLPSNIGVAGARNVGIKKASGKWIALLDSDDEWSSKKLKNQAKYLEMNPFFEILQCQEIWIRKGKRVNQCKHHAKEEGWIWEKSLKLCSISPSAVILRRELFDAFGMFQAEFPACEDYEMWLRISRKKPVGLNPEQDLIKYGGHADQLSARYPAMDRFRVAALLKILESEDDPLFRSKIVKALKQRLKILYSGAVKRNRLEASKLYSDLLNRIERDEYLSWNSFPLLLQKLP